MLKRIKQIKYFFTSLIKIIFLKFIKPPEVTNKNIDTLYLSSYPTHFDNYFVEDKYGDIKKNDYYLISVLTDGQHQTQSIFKYFKDIINLKSQRNKYILIDSTVMVMDLINAFLLSFFLKNKVNKLKSQNFRYKDIDISLFIKEEIDDSFMRIARILVLNNSIMKIFQSNKINNFSYYLFEFSYGRYFTYILNSYFQHIHKIAFQHGAPSRRTLLCYLAKKEPGYDKKDNIRHLPMPDTVLVENNYFKYIYSEAGYRNIKLMKSVYRLSYLNYINRSIIKENTVLVVFGMHDYNMIFAQLLERIREDKNTLYIFKFHPRTTPRNIINFVVNNNKINIKLADKHLSHYLSFVSKIIVTYSSVGYEAYLLGIPTEVLYLSNRINESPLNDKILLNNYISAGQKN